MSAHKCEAYAKINLTLDITGRREDGYHEMLMVMQTVSVTDDIALDIRPGTSVITVSTNRAFLPNNEKNLAYRAAELFFRETGKGGVDVDIDIKKRIPVCAGLGGGSSDAAAVLRGLNDALEMDLGREELTGIARKIGSDVAFCLTGGTALASGRGDVTEALPPLCGAFIVISKPAFSVSSPKLFKRIDQFRIKNHPDTEGMLEALRGGDLANVARRCYNVFEDALRDRDRREIEKLKETMLSFGALGASMTGTGSAVYGIFADKQDAERCRDELKAEYRETFLALPVGTLLP